MLGLLNKDIKLIGLNGRAGTGKDFIASNCLSQYFKVAFANHFKIDIVRKKIFTFDEVFNTKPKHVRDRLQKIGTEEGRDVYGEDIWIDTLEAWIHQINISNNINQFILADVRFENECEWVRKNNGIVITIESDRDREGLDEGQLKHISEKKLSEEFYDYVVINNKDTDLASLKYQINKILELAGL